MYKEKWVLFKLKVPTVSVFTTNESFQMRYYMKFFLGASELSDVKN